MMTLSHVMRGFLLLTGACSGHASVVSSWYYGVYTTPYQTGGGPAQILQTNGPANVTTQELNQSTRCCSNSPNDYYDQTADALLFGSATPDSMHAFVQATASITRGPITGPGRQDFVTSSFANLQFTSIDAIQFTSNTLTPGTPVSFQLTETLHSLVSATTAGRCDLPIGQGYSAKGGASLQVTTVGAGFVPLLDPLGHDSCGAGSDLMTLSGTFQSTIGGVFAFRTQLSNSSSAERTFAQSGIEQTSVDSLGTGLSIQVLTPGAGFTSDSGATYSSVPEPSTPMLFLSAGAILASWRMRCRRAGPFTFLGRRPFAIIIERNTLYGKDLPLRNPFEHSA